jgi:hypothetical protein
MWKRALWLVPAFVGTALAFTAAHDGLVGGSGALAEIAGRLSDPLVLFAKRSPGGRGSGALFSTKPERTAAIVPPHERVLSAVRERQPASGVQPSVGSPFSAVTPEGPSSSASVPGQSASPGGQSFASPFGYFPSGFGGIPGSQGANTSSSQISSSGGDNGGENITRSFPDSVDIAVPDQKTGASPSDLFVGGEIRIPDDLGTGIQPSQQIPGGAIVIPVTVSVPEPPSWAMMSLGLLVLAMKLRGRQSRRRTKRSRLC